METEQCRVHTVLREDYRTLLRVDAEIAIPNGCEYARAFYSKMLQTLVRWAEEVEGVRVRADYAACADNREKSRFQPCLFRVVGAVHPIDERYFAVVCRAVLIRNGEQGIRCSAQVWDGEEHTVLPMRQVLRRWLGRSRQPRLGYRADGCYPQKGAFVFFKNPHGSEPFEETRDDFEKKLTKSRKKVRKRS